MTAARTNARTYEASHPWITFGINLKKAPEALWVLLGEARSKCEHVSGTPIRPDVQRDLHQLFLAKGALGTTAIEGNTLSEDEVLRHLAGELRLPPSQQYLAQEIDNVVRACNDIALALIEGEFVPITPELIKDFNAAVLEGLELEEGVVPGEVRMSGAGVARYLGAPAEDCDYLIDRLCEWLNSTDFVSPDPEMGIITAIIKAVVAHLYVAWIHPFGDGNGRTARLLEFRILVGSGVPTPAAHLLSNHYNHTRASYYRELDRASKSGGEIVPFMLYAVKGFVDGLREQLDIIRDQQFDEAWQNYVHDQFRGKSSPADQRKRNLVLDLGKTTGLVPKAKLPEISPRLAAAYAGKTPKTLTRDVNDLLRMGLIARLPGGFRARREAIRAFMPLKADGLPT